MSEIVWAATALIAVATTAFTFLRAWRGWLDLKRFEAGAAREAERETPDVAPALRIELANVKERLRKLEAIATGVDP